MHKASVSYKKMKKLTYRLLLLVMLTMMTAWNQAEAKSVRVPKLYMFGFAASFNDTIVHFTEVQEVDSCWLNSSNGFLLGREFYSVQLREYLNHSLQMPNRTCIVVFSKSRSKAEKKFLKQHKLYTKSKDGKEHFDVRYVDSSDFHFKGVNMDPAQFEDQTARPQKSKKKRK